MANSDVSLTQNLALKAQLGVTTLKSFAKGILYNYSCLAAQNMMERQLCWTVLHQLRNCPYMNRYTKSRRQLHLIFPLNHQVSNLSNQFNLHA